MNSRATRLFARRLVPSLTLTLALMSGFGASPALAKSPEAARQLAEQSALGGDALTAPSSATPSARAASPRPSSASSSSRSARSASKATKSRSAPSRAPASTPAAGASTLSPSPA